MAFPEVLMHPLKERVIDPDRVTQMANHALDEVFSVEDELASPELLEEAHQELTRGNIPSDPLSVKRTAKARIDNTFIGKLGKPGIPRFGCIDLEVAHHQTVETPVTAQIILDIHHGLAASEAGEMLEHALLWYHVLYYYYERKPGEDPPLYIIPPHIDPPNYYFQFMIPFHGETTLFVCPEGYIDPNPDDSEKPKSEPYEVEFATDPVERISKPGTGGLIRAQGVGDHVAHAVGPPTNEDGIRTGITVTYVPRPRRR